MRPISSFVLILYVFLDVYMILSMFNRSNQEVSAADSIDRVFFFFVECHYLVIPIEL